MEIRELIQLMRKFQLLHRQQLQQIMVNEGIFWGQLPILEEIRKKGCCTQKELVDTLQVSPPSITTSIKRLEKKGYLQKEISQSDQRCTHISITPKGNDICIRCRNKFDEMDEKVFAGVSDNDKQLLYNILLTLKHNIENVKEECK